MSSQLATSPSVVQLTQVHHATHFLCHEKLVSFLCCALVLSAISPCGYQPSPVSMFGQVRVSAVDHATVTAQRSSAGDVLSSHKLTEAVISSCMRVSRGEARVDHQLRGQRRGSRHTLSALRLHHFQCYQNWLHAVTQ